MIPLIVGAASRAGRRPDNQDAYGVYRGPGWLLVVLADGMGGRPGGGVAARLALDSVASTVDPGAEDGGLADAVAAASARVGAAAAALDLPGMGTTLVAALVRLDGTGLWLSIGDSTLALDGQQLSRADNVATELEAAGLDADPGRSPGSLRQLTRVVDGRVLRPTVTPFFLAPGGLLQLSTDGLVDAPAQVAGCAGRWGVVRAAERLTDRAERRGSRDNITLVLVRRGRERGRHGAVLAAAAVLILGLVAVAAWPGGDTPPPGPEARENDAVRQTRVRIEAAAEGPAPARVDRASTDRAQAPKVEPRDLPPPPPVLEVEGSESTPADPPSPVWPPLDTRVERPGASGVLPSPDDAVPPPDPPRDEPDAGGDDGGRSVRFFVDLDPGWGR